MGSGGCDAAGQTLSKDAAAEQIPVWLDRYGVR
jgi:hypothetical protein